MIIKYVPKGLSRVIGRTVLKTQKHSPTILFVGGVTGMVASTVLACKATLHLEEVLNEQDVNLGRAQEALDLAKPEYGPEELRHDQIVIRTQTAVRLGKLYAPAAIIGVLSIAALTRSHIVLNKRNAALTAAYAATEKAFREYRERVAKEFGEEKESELRYAAEDREVVKDTKNGPKKKTIKGAGPDGASQYAKFFRPDNKNWNPTHELNLMFIKGVQNQLNDNLRANGHVFLNEAYDALGLERSKAGAVMGWLWAREDVSDDIIDFGVWTDKNLDRFHDYMIGREAELLLDFNVAEKPIWDLI